MDGIVPHRTTLRVRVEGRVQGVGFRYFVQEKAVSLGLSGWVRNLPDGSVEACAQGSRAALEKWLKDLNQGPPLSRVTAAHPEWNATQDFTEDTPQTFQIR